MKWWEIPLGLCAVAVGVWLLSFVGEEGASLLFGPAALLIGPGILPTLAAFLDWRDSRRRRG